MISLQDSAAVYDVPPLKESICFSRRESSCSFSRCWSHKLTLYFVVFKFVFCFFSKTQLAMQLAAEKNVGFLTGWVWHFTMAYIEGRTYGRLDSDVITKTKIYRIHGFTKFSYQWGSTRGAPPKEAWNNYLTGIVPGIKNLNEYTSCIF